jgi:calcineurin-like phosphoesterase family protein
MVKVLVIADEVASNLQERTLREIDPDLVLSAGDLPWDYLEWIASSVDVPMVFVPGNHDPEIESARGGRFGDYFEPGAMCDFPRPHGVINADQEVVEAAGLRIAGLGGCVRYRRGPHQYTQRQYRTRANRLLRKARSTGPVDVLLTHAPPRGLGDAEDGPHLGIEALHKVLLRLEPSWHLHGHIHPYGMTMPDRQVGPTTIRNVIPWMVVDITPKLSQVAANLA